MHEHRFMREAEMRRPELKRITAALRQLTPDQRKRVAVELAVLDAQPASMCLSRGASHVARRARTLSLCTRFGRVAMEKDSFVEKSILESGIISATLHNSR